MKFLSIIALVASLTGYVRPFVGTTNYGACNPGAVCPNGLMSVSPFNVMGSDLNTWDKDAGWWSTPYVYENKYFTGYSHLNFSGVGCPEGGILLTMPTSGPLQVDYHLYGSEYTDEEASPGYYCNRLLSGDIQTCVTATPRTSAELYSFHEGQANILLNLGEGLTNESGAWVRRVSDTEFEGMRMAGTFCYNPQAVFPVYFVVKVDKAPRESGFWKKQRPMGAEAAWDPDAGKYKIYKGYEREIAGDDIGCWFSFDVAEGEQILLRMGISAVSVEGARANLEAEQGGKDFTSICDAAMQMWESDLGRIRVEGGTREQREVFYTALYHTLIHPSVLNDVTGEYPLMESGGTGRVEPGRQRYSVFSLWDTYRNVHQLLTLAFPERQTDMVRSMIDMSREWGWMPKWELFGRETFTMEGDPAIAVITDTWLKGLRDYDIDTAVEAFIRSATAPGESNRMRPDIDPYIEKGYIPLGFFAQDFSGDNSVSHALEYYVADNALSLLLEDLGRHDEAVVFRQRAMGYRNYYDPGTGVLRPRNADGSFLSPFDPRDGEKFSNAPGFHEGSSWNYTFYVPHDVEGYASLMGGVKAFTSKLRRVFDEGLYDPANEPDIAYPYLFSRFKGYEWLTGKYVSEILSKYYTTAPDGIPGNDDTGTMSAWAVFSMMGLYPDCPGEPYYTLTAPVFDRVEISAPGTELVIRKSGNGRISSMRLGGKNLKSYRIGHRELLDGKELEFKLK